MKITLKFGEESREISFPDENILDVLKFREVPGISDIGAEFNKSLDNPIGCPGLSRMLEKKRPRKVLVTLVDITRSIPDYPLLLKILVDRLIRAGLKKQNIKFLVACGTHRMLSRAEMEKLYGKSVVNSFDIRNHDARSPDLYLAGRLTTGNELELNGLVKWADFIITTGRVLPHYFAGFSGGRKSVLPGISGERTIRRNHALVTDKAATLARLRGNPVHEEMCEAAKLAGVDFSVSVVMNGKKQITGFYCGEIIASHLAACRNYNATYGIRFKEPADCLIGSAGGYPEDISLYQAQKSLNNTASFVRPGGHIIMFAEAREEIGNPIFEKSLRQGLKFTLRNEIDIGEHTAYIAARLLQNLSIGFITRAKRESVTGINYIYHENFDCSLDYLYRKFGKNFKAYIVPESTLMFPAAPDSYI